MTSARTRNIQDGFARCCYLEISFSAPSSSGGFHVHTYLALSFQVAFTNEEPHIDTNIDWSTYMQQVSLVLSGERDYTAIKGSTGPLVYPAGHVYIYSLLHGLTDGGQNLLLGQGIFAILYLATLSIVMACYRSVNAPPYIFPLLMLSKRLHSVFLLRLFNDGFATFFLWGATYLLLKRQWARAVIVWSAGVSVKMTLLLVAPALAVILIFAVGFWNGIGLGAIALLLQVYLHLGSIGRRYDSQCLLYLLGIRGCAVSAGKCTRILH